MKFFLFFFFFTKKNEVFQITPFDYKKQGNFVWRNFFDIYVSHNQLFVVVEIAPLCLYILVKYLTIKVNNSFRHKFMNFC